MNPAIVVITFNRPNSLKRLLSFLSNAHYENGDINLIISVDYQDSQAHDEVLQIAHNYEWAYGSKEIVVHEENLGLRRHVISCGNFVNKFDSLIMLEDDLIVSPFFYSYAVKTLDYYADDEKIAGVSLYSHFYNYSANLPFYTIPDGYDVYFLQIAASWGQAWTKAQWTKFIHWYDSKPIINHEDNIPQQIKNWPESSWVKYFIKYLVSHDKYFVYPTRSLTSNMSDPGTHHKSKEYTFSVPFLLNFNATNLRLLGFADSINVYDSFFEIIPRVLTNMNKSFSQYNVSTIDTYGLKDLTHHKGKYVISSKKLIKLDGVEKSFGIDLKPMTMNLFYNIEGDKLFLAKAENFDQGIKDSYSESDWDFYHGKLRIRDYAQITLTKIVKKIFK